MKWFVLAGICLVFGMTSCTSMESGETVQKKRVPVKILNSEQAEEAEKSLEKNPGNLEVREGLAKYYSSAVFTNPQLRGRKYDNLRWFVENRPDYQLWSPEYSLDPVLDGQERFTRIGDLWQNAVKKYPKSAAVAFNAGKYFLLQEPLLAEKFLKKACDLNPNSSIYAFSLGHFYELSAFRRKGSVIQDAAEKALTEYERAYELDDSPGKAWLLPDIARAAWNMKQYELLARAAGRMENALKSQKENWFDGNLFYWFYISKGLLAVHEGNYEAAGTFLLKAGDTSGSPQLDTFGPNMILADQLLKHGGREAVLEFLEKIKKFWKPQFRKSDVWAKEIRDGKHPSFGANLRY